MEENAEEAAEWEIEVLIAGRIFKINNKRC